MGRENLLAIAGTEAERACKGIEDLQERCKAAMQATRNHWLVTDEDERFHAAVAAIYATSDENTQDRIRKELNILRTLSAGATGVVVQFPDVEEFEPIGLLRLWQEG